MTRACKNCEFYALGTGTGSGDLSMVCRREPPKPQLVPGGINPNNRQPMMALTSFFPPTDGESWCGEFKQRIVSGLGERIPPAASDGA